MTNWNQLLERTSPTLALSVPSLDEPLKQSVTHGGLALGMVRAVEALPWSPIDRRRALLAFAEFAQTPSRQLADIFLRSLHRASEGIPETPALLPEGPSLVYRLPALVESVDRIAAEDGRTIWRHAARVAELTSAFALRTRRHGEVVLRTADELTAYCHARTGVAAELVTELLVRHEPALTPIADTLLSMAGVSARGVSLVDFLDGAGTDRSPPCSLCVLEPLDQTTVAAISKDGILHAQEYVRMMRDVGARRPVVAFASLPIAWAKGRLDRILLQQQADFSDSRTLGRVQGVISASGSA